MIYDPIPFVNLVQKFLGLRRRFCPGPQTQGIFRGSYPKFFMPPKLFSQKNLFETYDKKQNSFPFEIFLPLRTLKPG